MHAHAPPKPRTVVEKHKYDHDNVFRSNLNIHPRADGGVR